jgi:hypothetical protein
MMREIFQTEFTNGATIRVYFADEPMDGWHLSDRIRLEMKPAGKAAFDVTMNAVEASMVLEGLTLAIREAIDKGVVLKV